MSSTSRRRERHLPPSEAGEVGKPGMRANGDAVLPGQRDRFAHDCRIPGVKAAGDVRRRHVRHDRGVLPEDVAPNDFTDVGVQIDSHGRDVSTNSHVILATLLQGRSRRDA